MTNIAPRRLILIAYELQDYQLAGDPSWMHSDNYDIQAKADGNPSVQQMEGPMLQALLEQRFKLSIIVRLVNFRSDTLTVGKNGPKLQASRERKLYSLRHGFAAPDTQAG